MADSDMIRNPDPRLLDFRDKPKWEYTNGLMCLTVLKVYQQSGNEKYLKYAKSYADAMILDSGEILTYKMSDYNIDRVNPGRFLIELNKISPNAKYQKAIDTLRKQMKGHPRTSEGGFWHKKIYPSQMWLDGLYMGSPFLTLYAKTYNEADLFDDVANQFLLIEKHSYVAETGLYKHGWDESRSQQWADKETGLSPHYWGRAMGWYAMAIVDVLENFPNDHPKRAQLIETAKRVALGIEKYQDKETGLWWQVMDKPSEEGNYLEASCSSMFTYFLLNAAQNGYIDKKYLAMGKNAYKSMLRQFIKENADGTISLTNVCAVAGLGGNPYRDGSYEYYVGEPQRDNDPKGVGPFIMASILMENMEKKSKK
jgi:unsaturated rhamnogalacturonyl hydrolase